MIQKGIETIGLLSFVGLVGLFVSSHVRTLRLAIGARHMCLCSGCAETMRTQIQYHSYRCPPAVMERFVIRCSILHSPFTCFSWHHLMAVTNPRRWSVTTYHIYMLIVIYCLCIFVYLCLDCLVRTSLTPLNLEVPHLSWARIQLVAEKARAPLRPGQSFTGSDISDAGVWQSFKSLQVFDYGHTMVYRHIRRMNIDEYDRTSD